MSLIASIKEIFLFFFKYGLKSKRARVFFILSFIPVLILLIAKIVELTNPDSLVTAADIFSRAMLIIYIQLLIPVLALFFGSQVINEELDDKTLIYLTTTPIPKPSIVLGKYLAYTLLASIIVNAGLLFSFFIINIDRLGDAAYLKNFVSFVAVGTLALIAYTAFFTLAGTLIKKALIFGLIFIFGYESIVQYLPGITQKLTFMHYIKSLLPYSAENVKFLVFRLEPSGTIESLLILLCITLIAIILSSFLFNRKEYILVDEL